MIVKESHVSAALEYLADTSVPAEARYYLRECERKADEIKHRLIRDGEGGAEMRKAAAIASSEYQIALQNVSCAEKAWEECVGKRLWAQEVNKIFQTENANVRMAERVR